MKLILLSTLFFLSSLAEDVPTKSSSPSWQNLDCEPGHKYIFSDLKMTWHEAVAECQLYGGWLVYIASRKEQNCLVKYAHSAGLQHWYFHDGKYIIYYIIILTFYFIT